MTEENVGLVVMLSYCHRFGTITFHQLFYFKLHDHLFVVAKMLKWKSHDFGIYLNEISMQMPRSISGRKLKKHNLLNKLKSRSIFVTMCPGCISQHNGYFSPCLATFLNYGFKRNFTTSILFRKLCLTRFPSCLSVYYCDEIVLGLIIFLFELDDVCSIAFLAITKTKLSSNAILIYLSFIGVQAVKLDACTQSLQKLPSPCNKWLMSRLVREECHLNCAANIRLFPKEVCCYENVKILFLLTLRLVSSQHKVLPVKLLSVDYIKSNVYSRNSSIHTQRKSLNKNEDDLTSYKIYEQVEVLLYKYCTEEGTLKSQHCLISCPFRSQYHKSHHEIVVNDINYPLPFSSEWSSVFGYDNYDIPQNEIYCSNDTSFASGICEKTVHKTLLLCNTSHCQSKLVPSLITCNKGNFNEEIVSENRRAVVIQDITSECRATNKQQVKNEMEKSLQGNMPGGFAKEGVLGASCPPLAKSNTSNSQKHLPPNIQAVSQTQLDARPENVTADLQSEADQQLTSNVAGATGYVIDRLPEAPPTLHQYYETDFDAEKPLSKEEKRKDVRVVPKEKEVNKILESYRKDETSSKKKSSSELQATAKPLTKPRTSANVDKLPRFPRRACVVYKNEQYSLDPKLLSLPRATKYLVKVRTEISPGRFMAKLELHCAR